MAWTVNPNDLGPLARPDFSMLSKLPALFNEGQEQGRQSALRSVLASDEAKQALASGDYSKVASLVSQYDPELGQKYMTTGSLSAGFGTPIYGKTADGKVVVGQLTRDKQIIWHGADGQPVEATKGVQFLNAGTEFIPTDRVTGAQVPGATVPIDNQGKAAATEQGQVQGQTAASIPDVELAAENAIAAIDEAINDPGRATATGKSSQWDPRNYFAGTEATSYREGTLKKVKGTAFLGSIQQMRGLGQLSNAEGNAATAAQTALTTEQTDEAHLQSLHELKALHLRGLMRTYLKAGKTPPAELTAQWRQEESVSGLGKKVPFVPILGMSGPSAAPRGNVAPATQPGELPVYDTPQGDDPLGIR